MTSGAEQTRPVPFARRRRSLDEQAAAKGTPLIGDGSVYVAMELFPEPGEVDEFIAFVYESRKAGTA